MDIFSDYVLVLSREKSIRSFKGTELDIATYNS